MNTYDKAHARQLRAQSLKAIAEEMTQPGQPVNLTAVKRQASLEFLVPLCDTFKQLLAAGLVPADEVVNISVVPKRVRWPEPGAAPVWAKSHDCVDALHALVRKIDLGCTEAEEASSLCWRN